MASATSRVYGQLPENGGEVTVFTLCNSNGLTAEVISYGATLTSLKLPTQEGGQREVTLQLPSLEAYLEHDFYSGATVGRVANRIGKARFELDGKVYELSRNSETSPHHLHGGLR